MEITEFDVRFSYAPNRVQRYEKKMIYARKIYKNLLKSEFFRTFASEIRPIR
jgi:hypothetical protein